MRTKKKEMYDCLFGRNSHRNALILAQEMLPVFQKTYGYYHPYVSCHMLKISQLLCVESKNVREIINFLEKTQDCIKITHGCNHELFRIAENIRRMLP